MSNQEEMENQARAEQEEQEAAIAKEKQLNLPKVTILMPKAQAASEKVKALFKVTETEHGIPHTLELVAENITGEQLDTISDCLWVGRAIGTPGTMTAQRLVSPGNGQVIGHPSDEVGRLSIGTNIDNLSEPLWIGINTTQFLLTYRSAFQALIGMGHQASAAEIKEKAAAKDGPEEEEKPTTGMTAPNKSKVGTPGIQQGEPA